MRMWETISQSTGNFIYFGMAVFGTTLFVLKLVLSLVAGHGDMDAGGLDVGGDASHLDFSGDHGGFDHGDVSGGDTHIEHDGAAAHPSSGAAFTLLSVQSILALMMGMGWAGLAARVEWHWSGVFALLVAGGFGFAMMVLASFLSFQIRRLNREIVVDVRTCVGTLGRVYLTIPPSGQGQGQIEVTISGRRRILPAVSVGEGIPAFSTAMVLRIEQDGSLLVEQRGE
jgi:hypothetical protein